MNGSPGAKRTKRSRHTRLSRSLNSRSNDGGANFIDCVANCVALVAKGLGSLQGLIGALPGRKIRRNPRVGFPPARHCRTDSGDRSAPLRRIESRSSRRVAWAAKGRASRAKAASKDSPS